ncbi:LysR family transcriptional regulator [Streptomyces sp. NPDC026673]|uniref:LysR family transcriptional regulator n=1 Tax=Streptomyces sp. NPDC026673 TaxID=3155724 RepID=UPI0033DD620B
MDRLETRELEYFLAVAEELHFSRAAQRLGIAQPPLSRAVARLERRMDVRLLERTSRRVELTAAGEVFLEECRRLLGELDGAVRRARQAAAPPGLALAVRPGTGSGLLAELVRSHDGIDTELVFTYDRVGALRAGTADVALLCLGSDDLTGLTTVEVAQEDPVALLPRGHRLAGRRTVTTAELRRDPAYTEQCPAVGLDEIVDRVALGRLVTVVGSAAADRLTRDVAAVAVADLPATTLALAWPAQAARPEVAAFARTARRVARDRERPTDPAPPPAAAPPPPA